MSQYVCELPKSQDFFLRTSWLFLLIRFTILTGLSFFSWNYFGLIICINFFYLITIITKEKNRINFFVNLLSYTLSFVAGALFWMLKLDYGIAGVSIVCLLYFFLLWIFKISYDKFKFNVAYIIPYLLTVELILCLLPVSFPWVILGNVLGNNPCIIGWYSLIGVLGGTFWILVISYFIYLVINKKISFLILGFIIISPIVYSFFGINASINNGDEIKVASVNPEKFSRKFNKEKFAFQVVKESKENNIDLLIFPELAIRGLDNSGLKKTKVFKEFESFLKDENKLLIIGTSGFKGKDSLVNSALVIDSYSTLSKNKKRLVPYTEYISPILYRFFKKVFYRDDIQDSYYNIKNTHKISVILCYESIYPFFVSKEVESSKYTVLLVSEEFMNESYYGSKQYDNIIKIRAIENNIDIIKSSSHGKSFIVYSNGKVFNKLNDSMNYFNYTTKAEINQSFFSKHGLLVNFLMIFLIFVVIRLK